MPEATQFCVGLDNKPGVLAKLCGTLRRAKVNIDALFVSDDEECCWVNLVANPTSAADDALKKEGYHFFVERVLTLQGENKPGELERVATKLADAEINVNYIYGSGVTGAWFVVVLHVSDVDRAVKLFEG